MIHSSLSAFLPPVNPFASRTHNIIIAKKAEFDKLFPRIFEGSDRFREYLTIRPL